VTDEEQRYETLTGERCGRLSGTGCENLFKPLSQCIVIELRLGGIWVD